jgi:glutamyl-Q tRNA(Asp) synthetase
VTQPVSSPSAGKPVFRFAPSPNGRLHLGHAYSALLNADFAWRWAGRLLLRIEDIDLTRCRPEYEEAVYEDLAWLGLQWEKPVLRQSERFADYQAAFGGLRARGLAYACFCSRRDIADAVARRESTGERWPHDPDGAPLYPGTCRPLGVDDAAARIAAREPYAWRLAMDRALAAAPGPHAYQCFDADGHVRPVEAHPARWGDAVIVRKETPTSYHLSVVVDDARQGVTHVVRGTDLEAATDLHVMLQRLLGLPTPLYHHHALLRDPGGDKLAKSARSEALADLRARGVTAEEIRARLGFPAAMPQVTPRT